MQLDVVLRIDAAYYPPRAPRPIHPSLICSPYLPAVATVVTMGEENGCVAALAAAMGSCKYSSFLCRSRRATRGRWRIVETLMEAL